MKFLQLKLLEAGEYMEKCHAILILIFLRAFICNHCPETGCWLDNSYSTPIGPF